MPTGMDSLDPVDWDRFRQEAHQFLDLLLSHVEERHDRLVWTDPLSGPPFESTMPEDGEGLRGVISRLQSQILPYDLGNLHPRFFGWVHGAGTPGGILAGAAEAALNANTGGRNHVGTRLEQHVLRWFSKAFGLPEEATGILTTGSSLANLTALAVARERALPGTRTGGLEATVGRPKIYASSEAHISVKKAAELLGLGTAAVVQIEVDEQLRMRPDRLAEAIQLDRAKGNPVIAVVASLGTASTGAIDPLHSIADIAQEFGVWLHTDAAFGGLVVLSDTKRMLASGIERSDSIAFDFHKWMHVAYAVGCLLVKSPDDHLAAFGGRPDYLRDAGAGPAGSSLRWPMEYGPELSRDFRALRVWWLATEHGRRGIGRAVAQSIALADELAALVKNRPALELLAEPELQIVVFRALGRSSNEDDLNALNRRVVAGLQQRGIVLPSETSVRTRTGIRVSISNHRTIRSDLHVLLEEVEREVTRIEH